MSFEEKEKNQGGRKKGKGGPEVAFYVFERQKRGKREKEGRKECQLAG